MSDWHIQFPPFPAKRHRGFVHRSQLASNDLGRTHGLHTCRTRMKMIQLIEVEVSSPILSNRFPKSRGLWGIFWGFSKYFVGQFQRNSDKPGNRSAVDNVLETLVVVGQYQINAVI
jgi:hypothetical protein